jgi:hypothetical protein
MTAAAGPLDSYRLPYLDMLVVLEDGRRLESHADQRDMRRAHLAMVSDPERDPLGYNMASAWAFLNRTGVIDGMGWKDFEAQVTFVVPLEVEAPGGADPTRRDMGS